MMKIQWFIVFVHPRACSKQLIEVLFSLCFHYMYVPYIIQCKCCFNEKKNILSLQLLYYATVVQLSAIAQKR